MQKTSGGTRLCSQPSRMKHSHGPVPGPSRRKQVSTNSWLNHLLRGDWSLVLCHCQYNGMLLWSYITNIKPGHIIHFKTGRHWNIPAHNKYILWHLNFHSQDASVQVYILCDDGMGLMTDHDLFAGAAPWHVIMTLTTPAPHDDLVTIN